MSTKNNGNPPPAYRVFISSTYEDMKEFRSAAADALTNIQAIPHGNGKVYSRKPTSY